ncbi:YkgJ family cysteine cluster protein [Desulfosediminicola flagellatus]|uniref:YkgJ family cysteine cluster protein n=1 Tax=Desulfosediminicola flagellatus TaxID=2569541 RepID=UPI0010AC3A4F|nr:YkgJ family cysteine cluster protein [Desulfosediminicola flagellatus]
MARPHFPESVYRLKPDESYCFACHPEVACFTECCRMLELALTPYDILRLRRGTGLSSQQLHDQYIIEERGEQDMFPKFYLTMVDDGRASCVFVGKDGCKIYTHRPGACRAYPLGRAAVRTRSGELKQHFVLLKENHCKGFDEPQEQTPQIYSKDQGLTEYNAYNDALAGLIQHDQIRQGKFMPNKEQLALYTLALHNLDVFREKLVSGELNVTSYPEEIVLDDEKLLLYAIDWLKIIFFPED